MLYHEHTWKALQIEPLIGGVIPPYSCDSTQNKYSEMRLICQSHLEKKLGQKEKGNYKTLEK